MIRDSIASLWPMFRQSSILATATSASPILIVPLESPAGPRLHRPASAEKLMLYASSPWPLSPPTRFRPWSHVARAWARCDALERGHYRGWNGPCQAELHRRADRTNGRRLRSASRQLAALHRRPGPTVPSRDLESSSSAACVPRPPPAASTARSSIQAQRSYCSSRTAPAYGLSGRSPANPDGAWASHLV